MVKSNLLNFSLKVLILFDYSLIDLKPLFKLSRYNLLTIFDNAIIFCIFCKLEFFFQVINTY